MTDVQELFQKDPQGLTKDDLREMVRYYRDKRNQFDLGDRQAGATKRFKKAEPGVKVSLDDILKDTDFLKGLT